jgi:succinate dehydrogenase/fumarate reductase flavoprotein subunit
MTQLSINPEMRAQVVVVGGGIAGTWVALKLARAGIDTLMIDYRGVERGGRKGSTSRSVGAVNTAPIDRSDFRDFMYQLGLGQVHPSVVAMMEGRLREELQELQAQGDFKPIKLGIALASGNAAALMRDLYKQFEAAGGRIIDAWVTRLVADYHGCSGVQYQVGERIGKVLAPFVVVASGGYAGLYDGSVNTNNFGTMVGRFLQAGGKATNLEFVFKHGYGKPDLGALQPTEELPGAEVYDSDHTHVDWLERELFEGRGTANHLQAFKHWRNNKDKDFFIDLKYREIYLQVRRLNEALASGGGAADVALRATLDMCPETERAALSELLEGWVRSGERINFERFNQIKPFFKTVATGEVFRVRQIAYFSMGGVGHVNCATNLANVFTTGEAMHDFGAHRVGGLPWGLYLAAASVICTQIKHQIEAGTVQGDDFALLAQSSRFDGALLQQLRVNLFHHQERDLNIVNATKFISWVRSQRRALLLARRDFDDGVAWTILAEGIMQASLHRVESRGCFYRADHPMSLEQMKDHFSCVDYDATDDVVTARMIRIPELATALYRNEHDSYRLAAG